MKTIIGIPSYQGWIRVEACNALINSVALYDDIIWLKGETSLTRARNELTRIFLDETDGDRMLQVDTDMVFTPNDMAKTLDWQDLEVVGGLYAARSKSKQKVVGDLCGPIQERTGLAEASLVGGGWMCVRREVFAKIKAKFPERQFTREDGNTLYDYWPERIEDPFRIVSEDVGFAWLARKAGVRLWIDTTVRLGHMGEIRFVLKE